MEKKKKKKRIIIVVIIIMLLCGIIGGLFALSSGISNMSNISVEDTEIIKVEKRDISNKISVSGNVESDSILKVTGTLNTKIVALNVEKGDYVNEGDVLCVFDSSELQRQYDSLSKNIQNTQNMNGNTHKINVRNLETAKQDKVISLAQAQRNIDNAISAQDRIYQKEADAVNSLNKTLAEHGETKSKLDSINQEEEPELYIETSQKLQELEISIKTKEETLEAIRDQFSTYNEAVQSAYDAYSMAERNADTAIQSYQDILDSEEFQQTNDYDADLQKLSEQIEACTIKASKSGIVTSVNITEGSVPMSDILMTIENTDAIKITVNINEADILSIKEGMPATVKTSATGDTEYKAVVSNVSNIYNFNAETQTGGYSAEITLEDKNNTDLLIGMKAKVQIILNEKKDVIAVPYDSIFMDDEKSTVILAVEESDGSKKAKYVRVEKGIEGSYYTEIISGDIKEGDSIVTNTDKYADGDIIVAGGQS